VDKEASLDNERERRTSILLGESEVSIFSRFLAKAIDALLLVAVFLLGGAVATIIGVLIAAIWCAALDSWGGGQSVGKKIMGLGVIDVTTELPCSFLNSFLRNFPFVLVILFASTTLLWGFLLLFAFPLILLEVYLLLTLNSRVRLGDVLGNTRVVERLEESFDVLR
jgi:uncharacterized RDD family membrane protein YckC